MIVRGNDFVTKEQFCSLCHISKKTAYKLIKSGRIKATMKNCGLLHYYEIPISEISRLQKIRGNIYKLDKDDLLDFLTSQYYLGITRKSNEHISDFIKLGILNEGGHRI